MRCRGHTYFRGHPGIGHQCTRSARESGYCGFHDLARIAARAASRPVRRAERKRADLERRTVELLERMQSELPPAEGDAQRYPLWKDARALLAEWKESR